MADLSQAVASPGWLGWLRREAGVVAILLIALALTITAITPSHFEEGGNSWAIARRG